MFLNIVSYGFYGKGAVYYCMHSVLYINKIHSIKFLPRGRCRHHVRGMYVLLKLNLSNTPFLTMLITSRIVNNTKPNATGI